MSAWSSWWESLGNWLNRNGWQDNGGHGMNGSTGDVIIDNGQNPFSGMSNVGEGLNDVTGVTASQQWQSQEAAAQRNWETAERIASQQYNSAEAQIARDWQLNMDSTQVQRRMEDLQAAGINPMAMVSGGNMLSGVGSSGSTAASVSPASGAAASGSGNSAAAVGGMIKATSGLVSAIIKAFVGKKK